MRKYPCLFQAFRLRQTFGIDSLIYEKYPIGRHLANESITTLEETMDALANGFRGTLNQVHIESTICTAFGGK